MNLIGKGILGTAMAAATLATAAPAQAHDGRGRRSGGDDAAIAVGAGIVGLAIGAAIASDHRDRDYYYDRGYYPRYRGGYYYRSYPAYPRGYYRNDDWRYREWREHERWERRHYDRYRGRYGW